MSQFNKTHSDYYLAADDRYDSMKYRRCGRSGLKLPALSIGLWHNFAFTDNFETARDLLKCAFDNGITHFDLANNYGPPYGAAEDNFGRIFKRDFLKTGMNLSCLPKQDGICGLVLMVTLVLANI